MYSECQEFKNNLTGSRPNAADKYQSGLPSQKGLDGAEGFISMMHSTHDEHLDAGFWWKASVLLQVGLCTELLE